MLVLLLLTAVLQPCKTNTHNRINVFFLTVILFVVLSAMAKFIALSETVLFKTFANVMLALSCSVSEIYIICWCYHLQTFCQPVLYTTAVSKSVSNMHKA